MTRKVIERIGVERAELFGVVGGDGPGEALVEGLVRLWDLAELDAVSVAAARGSRGGAAHLLRLVHTDGQGEVADSGGYSVTVIG